MCSIGTLFAFILVCGGVLILQQKDKQQADTSVTPKFKTPYINGKWIVPILCITVAVIYFKNPINVEETFPFDKGYDAWKHQIPFWIFLIVAVFMAYKSFTKNWSLIPVLGFLSCSYLVSTLGYTNWLRFLAWMVLGLIIYFVYGIKKSKLNQQ
ncbi:MAG: amino acid permease C-terminal domain-containing protein [Chitinophagales bacterium]